MASQINVIESEQENIQFLGFFGIFKESLKIILTWPKIFIQITFALILPQSILFLANHWISIYLVSKIHHNLYNLETNQISPPTYNNTSNSSIHYSEWVTYWIIKVVYYIFSIILSLLTISAVVYTVACIYTGKELTFRKVMRVVPKVWKRLMITFLCNSCIIIVYFFIIFLVVILPIMLFYKHNGKVGILVIGLVMVMLLILGLFYMTMIWQLANVVSVMEKNSGFKALKKSKDLIKGKMGTAFAILFVMNLVSIPILILIEIFVGFGILLKICLGILSIILWTLFTLFGLVVQTVFYLVCKSYHHESIDKSSLSGHLDVYLAEYVPLKSEAIQLERVHV